MATHCSIVRARDCRHTLRMASIKCGGREPMGGPDKREWLAGAISELFRDPTGRGSGGCRNHAAASDAGQVRSQRRQ